MALSGGATPKYRPGSIVTFATGGAIAQASFVEITADNTVSQAAAGSKKIVGVAMQASDGAGDNLPVMLLGYVFVMKAKGAVAAGDPIGSASDGTGAVSTIVPAAYGDLQKIFALATAAIADGATGPIYVRS